MAGFSKIYCIGGEGGFIGADGMNPISLQIWQGEGNRQWLEPHYIAPGFSPLGELRSVIPAWPDHPDALLDACLAFAPQLFKDCPSLVDVRAKLQDATMLDFNARANDVPSAWGKLREEARPLFQRLTIYVGRLEPLEGAK